MEIFVINSVFYEVYLKQILISYNFDIDNNLKQIKVYNIEEQYDLLLKLLK